MQRNYLRSLLLSFALTHISSAALSDAQQDCQGIFTKAPKNVTEVTDRSRELLTYGQAICSSEWKTLSDVQSSKQSLSLSILDYIGLTNNDTSATQKFENWKRENCDKRQLKKELYADLVRKQSFVSDLVYKAYEACISQRTANNATSCSYIPTNSAEDGFLFVFFAPNDNTTETTLNYPITLKNGSWDNGNATLPAATKLRLRENYFPLKRTDTKRGDFLRVSAKDFPGECSVEILPWPTFNVTLTLNVFYVQEAKARTSTFRVNWNANVGMGPSWVCLSEADARKTLNWTDGDPIDYKVSDVRFSLTSVGLVKGIPVNLIQNRTDKICGYFQADRASTGHYTFLVSGTRRKLMGSYTMNASSRGEPLILKVADWTAPSDAAAGTKLTYEYKLQISEQRDVIAQPVIELSSGLPTSGGYRSAVDSEGVVSLTYR